MKNTEQKSSRTAKILYRPWGFVISVVAGLMAARVVQRVWKRVDPDSSDAPPKPLQSEYGLRKVLLAALIQGAVFAVVRALLDRGGARVFQRWTGEWPGD